MGEKKYYEVVWPKKSKEFLKKECASETEGSRRRGRPVVRWRDRIKGPCIKELLIKGKGLNKQGGNVWICMLKQTTRRPATRPVM